MVLVVATQLFGKDPSSESISAKAAFLMNAETGEVLYQKNPDLPLPPASTTKVMTSILALESDRLNEFFQVPRAATLIQPSKINLRHGERVILQDLIYSLLLNSANDASLTVAIGLAGSKEKFAELMTSKAREIGADHTQFKNPHGLTEKGHFSTARDLALIFQHAMEIPMFREISGQRNWSIQASGQNLRPIQLRNHNRLLWEFDGAVFGKTGYTLAAKRCFVGSVSRDGTEMIVSVLGAKNLWSDTKKLVELGFGGRHDLFLKKPLVVQAKAPREEGAAAVKRGSSATSGRYSVQIASFKKKERAVDLKAEMAQKGYRATVDQLSRKGGRSFYRVRVAGYSTRASARSAAREFREIVGRQVIVVRSY
jgi:D-alanyl-D-alanine carboxypeptidase